MISNSKHKLAIFASGTGSNAQKIVSYFKNHAHIEVVLVVSNKKDAKVLDFAQEQNFPTIVLQRLSFYSPASIIDQLQDYSIDFIILAGFLWLVPPALIERYEDRILNIHPSLLPKYGGKGMYGHFVHEAVVANRETTSGMTIHLVNNEYDKGQILLQKSCLVTPTDDAKTVAANVLQLEHEFFAPTIEKYILESWKHNL